ncbi:hypothetical protein GQ54DRAFT_294715 [Martensiomyces pterosporus]|nr:hypothetical protein GQ54DRAFT_294715 [Martensiomyces pterosporus]
MFRSPLLFVAALSTAPHLLASAMKVDSLEGPVTQNEVASFKAAIKTLQPSSASANEWAQGNSGEQVKAMGLMYEISQDVEILDHMLVFCDKVLSIRNDLSGNGCKVWTGGVDPVWVDCSGSEPIATGGEQGDPPGHLGNCARQILSTKSIWAKAVPDNDPYKYGKTYLDRAKTYIKQADAAIDGHILKYQLNVADKGRQYFSSKDPYMSGGVVPWNQQMMFNYAFYNLAIAHELLGDNAAKAKQYHGLVQASVDWFFSAVKSYKDKKGNTAYNWGYNPTLPTGEDSNHGSLDVAGFSRLYASGRYGMTADKMGPFAYTVADNIILGPGNFAGRVDGTTGAGHSGATTYLRSGFLLTAEFLPSAAKTILSTDLATTKDSTSLDQFSRGMWVKYRLSKGSRTASIPAASPAAPENQ